MGIVKSVNNWNEKKSGDWYISVFRGDRPYTLIRMPGDRKTIEMLRRYKSVETLRGIGD